MKIGDKVEVTILEHDAWFGHGVMVGKVVDLSLLEYDLIEINVGEYKATVITDSKLSNIKKVGNEKI